MSDFDRTLTYGTVNGRKVPSIISLLRDGNYLSEDYAEKANFLFDKYHPIEKNPNISLMVKKKYMAEWWEKHYELLIKSGLSKNDLAKVVEDNRFLKIRRGAKKFLEILNKNNIPLVIFSASGLGEAVKMVFEKFNLNYPNISFIVNRFKWNNSGKAVSVMSPIIHSFNKDETSVSKFPGIYKKIKDRKNIILIGDSLGDAGMAKGFNYENIIKIGFLDINDKELEKQYKEKFDVLIKNNGSFYFMNSLLKEFV